MELKHYKLNNAVSIFFLFIIITTTACKKETKETPYFDLFSLNFKITSPPFPQKIFEIKNDKSFLLISSSPLDTVNYFSAIQDTVTGYITNEEMEKLINYCKIADVYNIKLTNRVNDTIDCFVTPTFTYTIKICDSKTHSNSFSYNYCFIPKEADDLKEYAYSLLLKYLQQNKYKIN